MGWKSVPDTEIKPVGTAAPSASVDDVILFVKNLCLTYSQLAIYPPHHPVSEKQMQIAWNELLPVFKKFGDVSISLANGKLLFFGMPVEERNPAVAKFAKHFESLLIHSIKFKSKCGFDKFRRFFELFCQDTKDVVEHGGIAAIAEKENIKDIEFNTTVYRVISEDEKIVKKTEVYSGKTGAALGNKEIIKYFAEKMIEQSGNTKEFLNEIKNNPEGLARQIIDFIEHIGIGQNFDSEAVIESLLKNIQLVSENISGADSSESAENKTISEAMLSLERELTRKSKKLSSKDSIHFIKRITDVVASYTEKAKAEKVIGEFLNNEKSLKAAETMMKELSAGTGSAEKILDRMKALMRDKGLSEDELLQNLEKNVGRKKIKKDAKKPLPASEKVKEILEHNLPDAKDRQKLVDYLDSVYRKEINEIVNEKTKEFSQQIESVKEILGRVHEVFEHTNVGMIIFDEDENIVFMDNEKHLSDELKIGGKITEDIKKQLLSFSSNHGEIKINRTIIWQVEKDDKKGIIKSVLFQTAEK
jgi:hypothetical protein